MAPERGAAAIMVAISMTALCLVAALVLDLGLLRFDKQANKSVADSAVMAGVLSVDGGTGKVMSFRGVCEALAYVEANHPDLGSLSDTWRYGSEAAVSGSNPCRTTSPEWDVECVPGDTSTWAWYSGSADSGRVKVTIKSGYRLTDPDPVVFPEESVLSADSGDPDEDGCDQLAVIIEETETPGFGKLATDDDFTTVVRTVGRVTFGDQGEAPVALLMLEQHDCDVIKVFGTGKVTVLGNGDRPGLIHSDSLGDGCSGTEKILNSNKTDGIVAKQAVAGSPLAAGIIGIVALTSEPGAQPGYAYSPDLAVRAENAVPGELPIGRSLVTRRPVDTRYIEGVRTTLTQANIAWTTPTGTVVSACTGAPPAAALTATGTVYFNCPTGVDYSSDVTLLASKVIFNGKLTVRASKSFTMPNAAEVYIRGAAGTGVDVKGSFRMRNIPTLLDAATPACDLSPTPATRGRLVIGQGSLATGGGGLFQACHTAVVLAGGQVTGSEAGCVPTMLGTAPDDDTLCDGVLAIGGTGDTDWTAPDLVDAGADSTDWDDLEDLALWTESEDKSSIGGSGDVTMSGIFFLPNADPFDMSGTGDQNVLNSQYVTRRLEVGGNAVLEMQPDPYDAIPVRYFDEFFLVR